jgi:hypothetical protein
MESRIASLRRAQVMGLARRLDLPKGFRRGPDSRKELVHLGQEPGEIAVAVAGSARDRFGLTPGLIWPTMRPIRVVPSLRSPRLFLTTLA